MSESTYQWVLVVLYFIGIVGKEESEWDCCFTCILLGLETPNRTDRGTGNRSNARSKCVSRIVGVWENLSEAGVPNAEETLSM